MMGDFPYAEGSLSPWDVNYKGLLADEAMSWVFRPSEKAKVIVSLDIKPDTEKGMQVDVGHFLQKHFLM